MRSLSADKCISDKRAAERLLQLRVLADWVFLFLSKHPAPLLGDRKQTTVVPPVKGQLHCWKYWLSRATGRTGKLSAQRHGSHGAASWSSVLLTPRRRTASCYSEAGTGGFNVSPSQEVSVENLGGKNNPLWRTTTVPNRTWGCGEKDAATHSAHRCLQVWTKAHRWKFTCRRLGLAEAPCRSVCAQYLIICVDF